MLCCQSKFFCTKKQTTFSSAVVVRISGWLNLLRNDVPPDMDWWWCRGRQWKRAVNRQPIPFNHAASTISSSLLLTMIKNHDWGHGRERTTALWCKSGNTRRPPQTVALYRSPSLPNMEIGCSDRTSGRGPWSRKRKYGYGLVQTERRWVWALPQMSWRTLCNRIDDVVHLSSDSRDYMPLSKINLETLERFLSAKSSWRVSAVVVGDHSKNSVKIYTGGGRTNLHKWRKFFFFGW